MVVALDPGTGDAISSRTYDGTASVRNCQPVCTSRCRLVDDDGVDLVAVGGGGDIFSAGTRLDQIGGRAQVRAFLRREASIPR